MDLAGQFRGVVVVETEEYARTHAKYRRAHMGRELFPELLAGRNADTVLASLRNEREHIGTHQVLELVRIDGKKPAVLFRHFGLGHDIELHFLKYQAAHHRVILVTKFSLTQVRHRPLLFANG